MECLSGAGNTLTSPNPLQVPILFLTSQVYGDRPCSTQEKTEA